MDVQSFVRLISPQFLLFQLSYFLSRLCHTLHVVFVVSLLRLQSPEELLEISAALNSRLMLAQCAFRDLHIYFFKLKRRGCSIDPRISLDFRTMTIGVALHSWIEGYENALEHTCAVQHANYGDFARQNTVGSNSRRLCDIFIRLHRYCQLPRRYHLTA